MNAFTPLLMMPRPSPYHRSLRQARFPIIILLTFQAFRQDCSR
jgi:hypothetical protein